MRAGVIDEIYLCTPTFPLPPGEQYEAAGDLITVQYKPITLHLKHLMNVGLLSSSTGD